MLRPCALLLAAILATAAAEEASPADLAGLPEVPNPYGFDLRLALRTHLEDAFAQRDVAGLAWPELVARYRALTTVAPPAEPTATLVDHRAREREATEKAQRDNIILQLELQFGERPAADTPTAELRARLDALVQRERERAPTTARAPIAEAEAAQPPAEVKRTQAPPAGVPTVTTFTADQITDATGVVGGAVITLDGGKGDRLVGICFNQDLAEHFAPVMSTFAGAMDRAKAARTGLLLLGHGDGINIGVGEEHPVNLTMHLRRNVAAYHTLLGVERIDCVAILSCSRKADSQFTAFRDGLGYYPNWRVSAWERTLQSVASGLAGIDLALAQPLGTDFRAAVYHAKEEGVASLAEAGQRTSTQYLQVDIQGNELVFSPARRR